MRVYINGILSKPNGEQLNGKECFLPVGLWFANPDEDFDFEITDNCLRLDGCYADGGVDEHSRFNCRWKGVELCHINNNGDYSVTEIFDINEFVNIIKEKNMRLVNMDAYYDGNINAEITSLIFSDNDTEYEFDNSLIDKIEFVELSIEEEQE